MFNDTFDVRHLMMIIVVVHWNVNDAAPIPSWQRLGGGCDVPTTLIAF